MLILGKRIDPGNIINSQTNTRGPFSSSHLFRLLSLCRRELFHSIIITGGTTLLPNFSERLYKELQERAPPNMYKIKLIATSTPIERKFRYSIVLSIYLSYPSIHRILL